MQVKGLRNCGRLGSGSESPLQPLACNRPFCPQCLPQRRRKDFRKWAPKVEAVAGTHGEVVAVTMTRPPRCGTLAEQKLAVKKVIGDLFHRQPWKRAGGFMEQVGILVSIEIGTGGIHDGLVHAHALVASAKPGVALAAAHWLVDSWLEVNPEASRLGQDVSPCRGPQDFGAWLNYVLKGCRLDPSWDDERLEAMALALLDRSQRVTPYGLLHPRRKDRCTNPHKRGATSIIPAHGSSRPTMISTRVELEQLNGIVSEQIEEYTMDGSGS